MAIGYILYIGQLPTGSPHGRKRGRAIALCDNADFHAADGLFLSVRWGGAGHIENYPLHQKTMRQVVLSFIILISATMLAQSDFKKKQQSANAILYTVITHDGKRYVTSDALFHAHELRECGWLKVEEKYKRMGVTMMVYFKLPADVQVMTWSQFLKRRGIVIHKKDTIFVSQDFPMGTLYEPVLSPAYVRGVKRRGHRVYILYNRNLNRPPSWDTQRVRDSVRMARQRQRKR